MNSTPHNPTLIPTIEDTRTADAHTDDAAAEGGVLAVDVKVVYPVRDGSHPVHVA
ncbi:hypothetical protein ACIBCN_18770 [Nocardia sp. NPDC051052]|uniref:hypothetical protein n=1 Tax=Nocardia sp. NPDC051052 TaxID=3364322 RepID=UPI0037B5CD3A